MTSQTTNAAAFPFGKIRDTALGAALLVISAACALAASSSALALPPDPIEPPDLNPHFVRPANGLAWSVPSRFGRSDSRGIVDYHWNELSGHAATLRQQCAEVIEETADYVMRRIT